LVLVAVVAYQVAGNEQLDSQNAGIQRDVASMQYRKVQLRSNISSMTTQNDGLLASIRALNITADSLEARIGLLDAYLNMQNTTTLVSNKIITVWPVIAGTPYSAPNMTLVLNFTAKYAGYLIIRSNVTTDAFVEVQSIFPLCNQHVAICQTSFSPSIGGYKPTLVPVLPGVVTVEVGSYAHITPQHAWISIDYIT